MKKLLLLLALSFSSAFAQEIKVLDVPQFRKADVRATFNINRELGRAWVETAVVERRFSAGDTDLFTDHHRSLVPGLSFDKNSNTIVLEHEGQLIECALVTQRGRSIFRHNVIRNKDCGFTSRMITVDVDNGFEINQQTRLQVFLVIK